MTEPHPANDDELREEPREERQRERRGFIPERASRLGIESLFVRIVATGGIIGIGTALGAILGWQEVAAWIIGIAVSTVTVLLAALLWSSRTL